MAHFMIAKTDTGRAWGLYIRRPMVSATVWELTAPEATFSTATAARAFAWERYGLQNWQRNQGRGSTVYRKATGGGRYDDALPVRFIVDSVGEVTAIFPTLCGSSVYDYTCYAHIGQHSSASDGWANARSHRNATPEERDSLYRELQGIYEQATDPNERSTLFVVDTAVRAWMTVQRAASYTGGR